MPGNHFISITSISEYFKNNRKQLKRGKVAYNDNHILKFQADPNQGIIVGEVKHNIRNEPYKVKLLINNDITDSSCSCPRSTDICYHIAALAIYTHYNLSSTDKACSWSVRKNKSSTEVNTINEIYGHLDVPDITSIEGDVNKCKDEISNLPISIGFSSESEPSEDNNTVLVDAIKTVVHDPKFRNLIQANNFSLLEEYIHTKFYITTNIVLQIAKDTIGQSKNDLWFHYRQNRLTASHFGRVLGACKRNMYTKSLFESLNNYKNLNGAHALQWGDINEVCGIRVLEQKQNINVMATGLWLANNGLLGASPDGLVNTTHIVEVKCPWKFRNAENLENKLEKYHDYILYKENNKIVVNKTHPYWDQIQGQLYLTHRQFCYLVVWTPQQTIITEIEKDIEWNKNLEILKTFFIQKYLPYLNNI